MNIIIHYGVPLGPIWSERLINGNMPSLVEALTETNPDIRRALMHFVDPRAGSADALDEKWLIATDEEGELYEVPEFGRVLRVIDPANDMPTYLTVDRRWGDSPRQVRAATFPVALCKRCHVSGWTAYPKGTVTADVGGRWCCLCGDAEASRWGYLPALNCAEEV